jgi:outer membrane protein assembly factor BamB
MALLAVASAGLAQSPQRPPSGRQVKSRPSNPNKLPPLSLFPIKTLWTLPLNNLLTVAPAYDAKRAYFPIEGGRLVAYDLDTGDLQWTIAIKPTLELVAGDGLIFVVESKKLTALRTTDGSMAWQHQLDDTLVVRPAWDNGWLVAATTGGTIIAFRAIDGFEVWRHDLPSPAHAPPALAADRVYVPGKNGHVTALRIDNGMPVWDRRLGGPPNDILALDDRVFVGSQDNFLYSIDTKDGTVDWRWRTGGDVIGLPAVDAQQVYFVSFDNVLRALSRKTGVQQWIRPLPLRPTTGPLLADGTVVVAGLSPTLRGYNTDDGKAAGDLPIEGEMAAPPHLVEAGSGSLARLVVVTREITKGASVLVVTRAVEPGFVAFAALPNPIGRITNAEEDEAEAAERAKENPPSKAPADAAPAKAPTGAAR